MIVEINNNNRKIVVEYKCKKILGTVEIRYIDEDTGELIKSELIEQIPFGQYEIPSSNIEGYDIIKEEILKEVVDKAYKKRNSPNDTLIEMKSFRDEVNNKL